MSLIHYEYLPSCQISQWFNETWEFPRTFSKIAIAIGTPFAGKGKTWISSVAVVKLPDGLARMIRE